MTNDAAVWLASLKSVAAEYQRAKAEERAVALRDTVRLKREARENALTAANSEMDMQRMRSAFAEQKDRRAVSSALERRDSDRRRVVESSLDARRQAAEFMSSRRENVALADNVARRIGACSKAHVRFVQQEHRDVGRQLAATTIQRQRSERHQRDVEVERVIEARRKAVSARADADRFVTRSSTTKLLFSQSPERNGTFLDMFVPNVIMILKLAILVFAENYKTSSVYRTVPRAETDEQIKHRKWSH